MGMRTWVSLTFHAGNIDPKGRHIMAEYVEKERPRLCVDGAILNGELVECRFDNTTPRDLNEDIIDFLVENDVPYILESGAPHTNHCPEIEVYHPDDLVPWPFRRGFAIPMEELPDGEGAAAGLYSGMTGDEMHKLINRLIADVRSAPEVAAPDPADTPHPESLEGIKQAITTWFKAMFRRSAA